MCVQLQKFRCRYPQLCPCTPNPSGSPLNTRSFSAISPEKTASECGVRENPIQPLLLSCARKAERYRKSQRILSPSISIHPRHSFSPIRFFPISRKKGLAPRLLNSPPFTARVSIGNPCIQVSGLPSRGNQVAHTCTACPSGSPAHPPRPRFISKYRNHQAPLPSLNPSRKNQTSYRRRIVTALNRSLSVLIPHGEYHRSVSPCPVSNSQSPIKLSPIENSSFRHTTVTKVCDCPNRSIKT